MEFSIKAGCLMFEVIVKVWIQILCDVGEFYVKHWTAVSPNVEPTVLDAELCFTPIKLLVSKWNQKKSLIFTIISSTSQRVSLFYVFVGFHIFSVIKHPKVKFFRWESEVCFASVLGSWWEKVLEKLLYEPHTPTEHEERLKTQS